jgi:uncharacterized protein with PIN domain
MNPLVHIPHCPLCGERMTEHMREEISVHVDEFRSEHATHSYQYECRRCAYTTPWPQP